jgi:IS5 family transposase
LRPDSYEQNRKRKRCQRRAAIEPIIGHLKSDFRLSGNFLKGIIGDHINAMMAAAAWNFSLWMRLFLAFLFSFNPRHTNRRVIA